MNQSVILEESQQRQLSEKGYLQSWRTTVETETITQEGSNDRRTVDLQGETLEQLVLRDKCFLRIRLQQQSYDLMIDTESEKCEEVEGKSRYMNPHSHCRNWATVGMSTDHD